MKVLVSQHTPTNMAPFEMLQEKFGAEVEFHPFFVMEALSGKEFRAKKINLPDYTAVVFSSRLAIDAYFKLCEEMRFKVPDTTEAVAMYLQKHIVYRKRKIFYGTGTPESVVALIGPKHKGEKFLIAASDGANSGRLQLRPHHRSLRQGGAGLHPRHHREGRAPGHQRPGHPLLRDSGALQPLRRRLPQGKLP